MYSIQQNILCYIYTIYGHTRHLAPVYCWADVHKKDKLALEPSFYCSTKHYDSPSSVHSRNNTCHSHLTWTSHT